MRLVMVLLAAGLNPPQRNLKVSDIKGRELGTQTRPDHFPRWRTLPANFTELVRHRVCLHSSSVCIDLTFDPNFKCMAFFTDGFVDGQRSDSEDEEERTSGRTKCSYCPQLCTSRNLKRHEDLHFFDEAKYECDYCTYSSDCRKSVVRHEKLHGARQTKAPTICTKSTPKKIQKGITVQIHPQSSSFVENELLPRWRHSISFFVDNIQFWYFGSCK